MDLFGSLIQFLLEWLMLFKFWRLIPRHKLGVRLRLGTGIKILKPGIHFVLPFELDHVKTVIIKPEWISSTAIHITTADFKTATFGAVLAYRIVDPIKWLYECNDAPNNLHDILRFCTSDILTECNWSDCTKKPVWTKIKNSIKVKAKDLGIEVDDFGLIDLSLSRIIITSV